MRRFRQSLASRADAPCRRRRPRGARRGHARRRVDVARARARRRQGDRGRGRAGPRRARRAQAAAVARRRGAAHRAGRRGRPHGSATHARDDVGAARPVADLLRRRVSSRDRSTSTCSRRALAAVRFGEAARQPGRPLAGGAAAGRHQPAPRDAADRRPLRAAVARAARRHAHAGRAGGRRWRRACPPPSARARTRRSRPVSPISRCTGCSSHDASRTDPGLRCPAPRIRAPGAGRSRRSRARATPRGAAAGIVRNGPRTAQCVLARDARPTSTGNGRTMAATMKTAIVTGAGTGIGRAAAVALLEHGYRVALRRTAARAARRGHRGDRSARRARARRAHRRRRSRVGRRAVRAGQVRVRAPRRAVQQRGRRRAADPARGPDVRAVEERRRHQPDRRVPVHAGGDPHHEGRSRRAAAASSTTARSPRTRRGPTRRRTRRRSTRSPASPSRRRSTGAGTTSRAARSTSATPAPRWPRRWRPACRRPTARSRSSR